jgi:hypothetical protein
VSVASLCTRPVVLVKRTRTTNNDPYGDDALVDGERIPLLAQVHQRTTTEDEAEQSTQSAAWIAMLPFDPAVTITGDDVVEVDGQRFEIEGVAFAAWHPLQQRFHHWELALVETVG